MPAPSSFSPPLLYRCINDVFSLFIELVFSRTGWFFFRAKVILGDIDVKDGERLANELNYE